MANKWRTPTVFNTPTPDKVLKSGQGLQVPWKVSTRNLKIDDLFNPRSKKRTITRGGSCWMETLKSTISINFVQGLQTLFDSTHRFKLYPRLHNQHRESIIKSAKCLPSYQSSLWDMVEVNHDPRPRPCLQLLVPK